jgi:hypothetical protein
MAEWLKAAVLKTVEERSSGSSNLPPSAMYETEDPQVIFMACGFFVV